MPSFGDDRLDWDDFPDEDDRPLCFRCDVAKKMYTLDDAMASVAKSLREYGYPDVTTKMIREIYDEYETGKRYPNLPHSVIGGFAQSQFDEVAEQLKKLPR